MGCRRARPKLRIQVWGTGRGIPPNQLASIFEEFHQVGNPERDRRQGQGLGQGLAIVELLATLLRHPIRVHSTPGRGSMFEILVPLASPDAPFQRTRRRPYPGRQTCSLPISGSRARKPNPRRSGGWSGISMPGCLESS
ncbi:MAG: sensor histidine kinase [Alphaproteobacteria bacterium]